MPVFLPAASRGTTQIDWLYSRHSFSFGDYYNPNRMGFGPLRVLNDDVVAPGAGFPTHPHRDAEILTWVLKGALAHKDSAGHSGTIGAGDVQFMRAGAGVTHSEYNPDPDAESHFLQIWLLPHTKGLTPAYAQRSLPAALWLY